MHVEYPQALCGNVLLENMAMPCKVYGETKAFSIRLSTNTQELTVMKSAAITRMTVIEVVVKQTHKAKP